jgi:hypothetical protein
MAAGTFSSGLQHYIQFGQFGPNRAALFTGSIENDTLTGFAGIDVENNLTAGFSQEQFYFRFISDTKQVAEIGFLFDYKIDESDRIYPKKSNFNLLIY